MECAARLKSMLKPTVWHLVTSEYPPQIGGVSDYTKLLAAGLANAGDTVHVWCPPVKSGAAGAPEPPAIGAPVFLHREMGDFTRADLHRVGRLLDQFGSPRRLLVQWVPHGYGYRAMNVAFCLWLWKRAKIKQDQVELMVHEPSLGFGEGSWKQSVVAVVHRLMIVILLMAAKRVWVSIPQWETRFRPFGLGRNILFGLLPVPSNVPVVDAPAAISNLRVRYGSPGNFLLGHFGAYDNYMRDLMRKLVPALLTQGHGISILFLGKGSLELRNLLVSEFPALAGDLHATGVLSHEDVSLHISACDVMLQPYQDGVSGRRGSVMASLAHGAAVVTTLGNATESCWVESRAVKLVKAGGIEALAEAATSLLGDAAERRRLSVAGKELYEERFDLKRTVARLREAVA
jgi:glycosyltransferase involved in cell wall biosynthesis